MQYLLFGLLALCAVLSVGAEKDDQRKNAAICAGYVTLALVVTFLISGRA